MYIYIEANMKNIKNNWKEIKFMITIENKCSDF